MKKVISCLLITLLHFSILNAQTDTVKYRIFLIGDAGELENGKHPVVDWLKKNVNWNDTSNIAIFLGDNIYPYGMPDEGDPEYEEAKKVIDYQIDLVKGKRSQAYFVLGNHDWKNGKIGGWERAMNQQDYINSKRDTSTNIEALPRDGCPGPEIVELDKVVLVFMDSQWFLHLHEKPALTSNCKSKTVIQFGTELAEIAARHPDQLLILAMHHPLHSHGVHGGETYNLKDYIFPLANIVKGLYIPIPFVYPVVRGWFGNLQDERHPIYKDMVDAIEGVLKNHKNAMTVAGHDHSLQFLQYDSMYQVISGSGAKQTKISTKQHKEGSVLYAVSDKGFSMVEVRKSGKTEIKYYTVQSNNLATPAFAHPLKQIVTDTSVASSPEKISLPETYTWPADSTLGGNALNKLLIGRNYRKEWTQPVTVPVFDIGKEEGGFKPTRKGGGKQTKSLRLEDSTGKEWALRSVTKYPDAAIPPDLRNTIAKEIVHQGVSASYPFASLSINPLATAAGIPSLRRKLVYIPDDPNLLRYRADFQNSLAILEEREPGGKKTYNTDDLVLRLAKDNDDHVDQKAVLTARLLDNFIMDFDRHEDQWRWATYDTGKGKMYYPIPRDHDQAFFVNQGILPYFARKPWLIPELQGFNKDAENIKTFNKTARNLDRFFMTELSANDWEIAIDKFLSAMTDDIIETALKQQPKEIQQYSMNKIINTLKLKRKYFKEDMMEYYRFLSREVNVVGSNQKEQFSITKQNDGKVHVVVNKIDKQGTISSKIYDRVFEPGVTREIRIYGLSDDDIFKVEGGESPIKVRIIGGPGNDEFINTGSGGRVMIYDASFEQNQVAGNPGLTNRISADPQVNRFNRFGYKYNLFNPGLSIAYNIDDGLYLGVRAEITRQGFRKEPYGARHYFEANRALRTSSFRFRYDADFIKVIGNHDLVLRSDIRAPINVTNFFGLGNNTTIDESKPLRQYYRARYDIADVSLLLRRQLQSWMQIHYGTTFQYFRLEEAENRDKYVSNTRLNGLDSTKLYEGHMYGGGLFHLLVNSRNSPVLPSRGALFNISVRPMLGLNKYSSTVTQLNTSLAFFMSVTSRATLVGAVRVGYGTNFGKYEFPQAQYLSGTENLRGYRKHRFAGRSMMYNNLELRYRAANFTTFLFPGSFGLHAFHDIGKVYADQNKSKQWHNGYGAGVWIAPVRRFVLTGSLTFSKEETALPLLTFGFFF